jgi:hypothetical protein
MAALRIDMSDREGGPCFLSKSGFLMIAFKVYGQLRGCLDILWLDLFQTDVDNLREDHHCMCK